MIPVSPRDTDLPVSPIRRMAVGAPPGTISLGLGEPGWPLPAAARDALVALGEVDARLPYGPNAGRPELIDAVAAFHSATSGVETAADQVMLTSGSQAALFALFQVYAAPGTSVLVPDPGFVSYAALAHQRGAEPVPYPLGPGGELDADALVHALARARHTSVVVVNHPANPTGGMAGAPALRQVAEACARAGALLVSDEVYRELWLDERPAGLHEAAGVAAGVVLGSMSKAFGAPGLRVGWAVGQPDVLLRARIVHNAMTTAPAQPSQLAAVALLEAGEKVLTQAREHVRRRWESLGRVAPSLAGAELAPGRAGFYLWLPLPGGVAPEDTEAFALRVRDESLVTTVPGTAFGTRGAGYLRVSLGGPLNELEEGLRRLAPWWKA